ncbi:riboflavin synthase [Longispora sp. NPDC051575]|uniref:riboflavin synthase n=1 Tax=Longispora sp. NPDC051575 TaxID=3154943 RepID=UPI00342F45A7
MFTGIVEELGEITALEWHGAGAVLTVRGPKVTSDAGHGDSIAVNGVCLTVVTVERDSFTADVMKESFDRSSLGAISVGDRVNLERAATLSTRLGGHLVQGHVDGVGTILSRTPGEMQEDVRITLPADLNRYVVEKGSITVDGISLTVAVIDDDSFTVSLIPTTVDVTTLGRKAVGEQVNLEIDVIAKYVEKLVRTS